jgi:drug/metabolite transporter (DMT)-like permease
MGLLALIGGFTFVLIKASVATLDPTSFVLIVDASAALTLGLIFAAMRRNPVQAGMRRSVPGFVLLGLMNTIPFLAFGWGEQYISSGLVAILIATTPLWTAVIGYWLMPGERPGRLGYLGVAIGFCGIGILMSPQIMGGQLHLDALASIAVLGGAASIAVATLGQRRLLAGVHPVDVSLWQWVISTVVMIPIAAPGLGHLRPSLTSLGAAIAVGAVCSGLASVIYYFIMNSVGATRGSTVLFLVPVTAVVWGAVVYAEPLTGFILGGMAVVLLGMLLTMVRRRPRVALAPALVEETAQAAP